MLHLSKKVHVYLDHLTGQGQGWIINQPLAFQLNPSIHAVFRCFALLETIDDLRTILTTLRPAGMTT